MSSISNDLSTITGSSTTPQQQAEEALVGTPNPIVEGETAQESADATLVELSGASTGSSNVGSELAAGVPADVAAAGALVSDLAGQISGSGSEASTVHSLLSADAAFKLTQA